MPTLYSIETSADNTALNETNLEDIMQQTFLVRLLPGLSTGYAWPANRTSSSRRQQPGLQGCFWAATAPVRAMGPVIPF